MLRQNVGFIKNKMRTSIGRIDGNTYLTGVYYAPFAMLSPLLVSNLGVVIANEGDVHCTIWKMHPHA